MEDIPKVMTTQFLKSQSQSPWLPPLPRAAHPVPPSSRRCQAGSCPNTARSPEHSGPERPDNGRAVCKHQHVFVIEEEKHARGKRSNAKRRCVRQVHYLKLQTCGHWAAPVAWTPVTVLMACLRSNLLERCSDIVFFSYRHLCITYINTPFR